MSDVKHTPGPWPWKYTGDGKRITIGAGLVEGPGGYEVAEVYSDDCPPEVAEANARLIALATILPDLYASEINATLTWFWDGGFDVSLGDEMNGVRAEGNCREYVDALEWLRDKAIEFYPISVFAKRYAKATTP